MSETTMTAMAPVAPEIIPGSPPMSAAISPMKNAEEIPTTGETPARKANATASVTSAIATISPDRGTIVRASGFACCHESSVVRQRRALHDFA